MVRVIYLGFFFLLWRILSFHCHSPLIPVSHKFSSFPSHSPHSVSPHSPHSVSPHSPHSVSPHSPVIPLSFPSSFGFPSFPSHSTVIWFPLIPLSFPSFGFSNSPVIPLIPLGFPSFGFPSCIPSSLSALFLFPCSLSVLSRHSPVLWRSRTTSQIQGARGRRARPQGSAPHSQFSSFPPLAVSPPVCVSLFVLDPVTGKQGRDWLGKLRNVRERLCFLWLACDEFGWVFLWACLNVTRKWRKLGMGKKLTGSFPNHDGLFAQQIQIQRNSFFRNRQQINKIKDFLL